MKIRRIAAVLVLCFAAVLFHGAGIAGGAAAQAAGPVRGETPKSGYKASASAGVSNSSVGRAISTDRIVIYGGEIVQYDYRYPWEIVLTVNENGTACSGVQWASDNESVIQIDEAGQVTWSKYGTAVLTGTLDGETYRCEAEIRELRMYEYWVYTGDPDSNRWIWDYTFCMAVGQTVPYRLEEWTYDASGNVVRKEDVTQKYPLTAENPEYLEVQPGSVTALKPGSCQEDRTSGVYCELENETIAPHQRIRFHIFTEAIEELTDYFQLRYEFNEPDSLDVASCYLTTNYYVGYFPLDDSGFIRTTDWYLNRCLPEEFEWRSSDTGIVRFTGKTEGSNPYLEAYSRAYFDIVGEGPVELSVWYNGTMLASVSQTFTPMPPMPHHDFSFTLPDQLTTLEAGAFSGMTSLESVELPSGLSSIPENAFAGCTNLREIYIPDSVESIDRTAFDNCPNDMVIFGSANSKASEFAEGRFRFREMEP